MLFISNLVKTILLPPGCIILLLLLVTVFIIYQGFNTPSFRAKVLIPRRYKISLGIITVLLYFLSIQPVADFLLRPLEDAYPPLLSGDLNQSKDSWEGLEAIVILGGGTIQNSPEARDGRDTLASDAMKRAVYAFDLRDYFPVPYVFSGGIVFDYNQESEAATAGRFFVSLGLPYERLMLEAKSRNTWENARETAKLGIKRAILVTSAYHMPRSVFCFERNGIAVIPAPTDYKCARGKKTDFFSFMPSMGSLGKTYQALHEYIGLLSYRILYRSR